MQSKEGEKTVLKFKIFLTNFQFKKGNKVFIINFILLYK